MSMSCVKKNSISTVTSWKPIGLSNRFDIMNCFAIMFWWNRQEHDSQSQMTKKAGGSSQLDEEQYIENIAIYWKI